MDTIGTSKLVLLIEMSFAEGSLNIYNKESKRDKKTVPCSEVSFIRGSNVMPAYMTYIIMLKILSALLFVLQTVMLELHRRNIWY